ECIAFRSLPSSAPHEYQHEHGRHDSAGHRDQIGPVADLLGPLGRGLLDPGGHVEPVGEFADGRGEFGPLTFDVGHLVRTTTVVGCGHFVAPFAASMSARTLAAVRSGTGGAAFFAFEAPTAARMPPMTSTTSATIRAASHGSTAVARPSTAVAISVARPRNNRIAPAPEIPTPTPMRVPLDLTSSSACETSVRTRVETCSVSRSVSSTVDRFFGCSATGRALPAGVVIADSFPSWAR